MVAKYAGAVILIMILKNHASIPTKINPSPKNKEESEVHDIYERYYGKRKKTQGAKLGSKRCAYKSHMKPQTLNQKRQKDRIRQRKHRKKQKMLDKHQKCHGNLNEGSTSTPNVKDDAHISRQNHSGLKNNASPQGILLISRLTRQSEEKKEVRSSQ